MTDHRIPIDPFRNRELEKKKSEAEKVILKRLAAAYRNLFDNPQSCSKEDARSVFKDIVDFCMVFDTTCTGNSWSFFNEGKRAVGLHVFEMREYGIEQELTLMREETYKTKERKD